MKDGLIGGVIFSAGLALIGKISYELGKNHEKKELFKIAKTLEIARKAYEKKVEES